MPNKILEKFWKDFRTFLNNSEIKTFLQIFEEFYLKNANTAHYSQFSETWRTIATSIEVYGEGEDSGK